MSEVDRLSTSGTYPALALTDRRPGREQRRSSSAGTDEQDTSEPKPARGVSNAVPGGRSDALIDEYA